MLTLKKIAVGGDRACFLSPSIEFVCIAIWPFGSEGRLGTAGGWSSLACCSFFYPVPPMECLPVRSGISSREPMRSPSRAFIPGSTRRSKNSPGNTREILSRFCAWGATRWSFAAFIRGIGTRHVSSLPSALFPLGLIEHEAKSKSPRAVLTHPAKAWRWRPASYSKSSKTEHRFFPCAHKFFLPFSCPA
jgi:hypothetical protein